MDEKSLRNAVSLLSLKTRGIVSIVADKEFIHNYNLLLEAAKFIYPKRPDLQSMKPYSSVIGVFLDDYEQGLGRLRAALGIVSLNPSEIQTILHPIIVRHAYPQFLDGHLRSAVLDAFIAVFDLIRERTGLELDGAELVARAFSLSDPLLIVSELDTDSGKNDQKGFIQMLQGAYLGVRNPKAHSLISDLSAESAAQYLAFASLLARRIEESVLVERPM